MGEAAGQVKACERYYIFFFMRIREGVERGRYCEAAGRTEAVAVGA